MNVLSIHAAVCRGLRGAIKHCKRSAPEFGGWTSELGSTTTQSWAVGTMRLAIKCRCNIRHTLQLPVRSCIQCKARGWSAHPCTQHQNPTERPL